MKNISIEDLAYHLKEAEKAGLPKPIFFIGAGASVTGQIPLAGEIEKKILNDYSDNPNIAKLSNNEKTYAQLMNCLLPSQRNELMYGYIENAKINVTHIYLAQLMKEELIDYVVTVNFDNLMLRALALFDIFPPVYDLTSLSDFTTTTIKPKSVVYLHGQHHGNWLLNTPDEMSKVHSFVPRIFDTIKNQRPWIFLGYSGNDPILEHIKNLGRFDNGLYWVGYDNHLPNKAVQELLKTTNTNTHLIQGYDADSFMLKLNNELDLPQPDILDKPFSSLKSMLANIVDIDDKDHFRGAKIRMEIAQKNINTCVDIFEEFTAQSLDSKELKLDKLKKDIIDLIITEKYSNTEIKNLEPLVVEKDDIATNELLSELYFYKGVQGFVEKNGGYAPLNNECAINECIESFKKSVCFKPESFEALFNWGNGLLSLAKMKTGEEAKVLYEEALEKFKLTYQMGLGSYNLACTYALIHDKENAFKYLDISLIKQDITTEFVLKDEDWQSYLNDDEFRDIIDKYC